jgi:hypothetical protein
LREREGGHLFADAARPLEAVRMVDFARPKGPLERLRCCRLTEDSLETHASS